MRFVHHGVTRRLYLRSRVNNISYHFYFRYTYIILYRIIYIKVNFFFVIVVNLAAVDFALCDTLSTLPLSTRSLEPLWFGVALIVQRRKSFVWQMMFSVALPFYYSTKCSSFSSLIMYPTAFHRLAFNGFKYTHLFHWVRFRCFCPIPSLSPHFKTFENFFTFTLPTTHSSP